LFIDYRHAPPFSRGRIFSVVLDRLNDPLEQLDLAFFITVIVPSFSKIAA
jgi:hypothetical protein